jgi:hypothetical protein
MSHTALTALQQIMRELRPQHLRRKNALELAFTANENSHMIPEILVSIFYRPTFVSE